MSEAGGSAIARMRCSDIMTRDVRTATPQMTLGEVAQMMRDGDMGSVPVVEDGRLIGIVTDRDIVVRCIAEGRGADAAVKEAMTTEISRSSPTISFLRRSD